MRISDWSSDVCSSDLNWPVAAPDPVSERAVAHDHLDIAILEISDRPPSPTQPRGEFTRALQGAVGIEQAVPPIDLERGSRVLEGRFRQCVDELINRSEEHTSELQSLMRISYAV